MSFKIAAFNVENLFDRAKAFNHDAPDAQAAIAAVADINILFEEAEYTAAIKREILRIIEDRLQLNRFNESSLARVRTLRGRLIRRPRSRPAEIVAAGRDDWIGWAELKTDSINEIAIDNTGRVIRDVDADVLAVVEAENRIVLQQFTENVFRRVLDELPETDRPTPYDNFMLIDGNDARGIDVGIMSKADFTIGDMRSHINDRLPDGRRIYSRDCPEYAVTTPDGERLWVLPNHFKSKFGGNDERSIAKRRAQAQRTAEIYQALRDKEEELIVVLGDLNDTPGSEPLTPLLTSELRDVSEHANFDPGPFDVPESNTSRGIGTFGLGNDNQKIDYLLCSPALFDRVSSAGLFRKGVWPGVRPKPRWPVYPEITRKVHVASDHHVIWAVFD